MHFEPGRWRPYRNPTLDRSQPPEIAVGLAAQPGATHLKMRSADQFYEVVSVDAIKGDPRIVLTYAWDGVPMSREHGFPLRICIPDVHGMKQPKWIECIEAIDHWEAGYWVERGWNKVAHMHATSMGAGGATHSAFAVDLGHLAIRLALSVGQAHLYRSVL